MPINLNFLDTFDVFKWGQEEKKVTQQESVTPPPLGTANPNDKPNYMELSKNSTFTGDKTDVALIEKASPGDPDVGLGIWIDSKGQEQYFTEIDDRASEVLDNNYSKFILDKDYRTSLNKNVVQTTLDNLFKHDDFFNKHPEYKGYQVELRKTADPKGPYTDSEGNSLAVAAFHYPRENNKEGKLIIHADKIKDKKYLKSVLLHELQHERDYQSRVIQDGKANDYVQRYVYDSNGNITTKEKDYQRVDTPVNTEVLSEVVEDRALEQNNSVPENYLVTQHLKRIIGESDTVPADDDVEQIARRRIDEFMEELAYVESRNRNIANQTGESSAQGYFQFLTDTSKGQSALQTAIKRVKKYFGNRKIDWLDKVYETGDVLSLTYEQQKLLALGDLLEKPGSDKLWKAFIQAKDAKEATKIKREIYSKLHHTDVSGKNKEAIEKNMDTIWKL